MAAAVLFDAPGPKTVARHRVYTVVAAVLVLLAIAYVVMRLHDAGQFDYALWEPFVTPNIMQAIGQAWLGTVTMAVLAVLGALVFGLFFGVAKLSAHKPVRSAAWLVVEFFRAVPVIMLMIFTFYGIFNSLSIERGAYWSVVLSLTVYNGAVLAEVFRAGVNALPRGQAEAAYAVGMRKTQVMRLVLLPQAVKIMIPAIISQCIVALKDTSLGFYVLAPGLTTVGRSIWIEFGNQLQTALVLSAIYIICNLILTALATWAQRRLVGERKPIIHTAEPGMEQGGPVL